MSKRLNKEIFARTLGLTAFLVVAPSVAIAPPSALSVSTGTAQVGRALAANTSKTSQKIIVVAHAATLSGVRTMRASVTRKMTVKSGDTLMKVALAAGIDRGEAHSAIKALSKLYDPRRLAPGQKLTVTYTPKRTKDDRIRLEGLLLQANQYQGFDVRRDESDRFVGSKVTKELVTGLVRARGTINSNLFNSASEANVPPGILLELVRLYSWDVSVTLDRTAAGTNTQRRSRKIPERIAHHV